MTLRIPQLGQLPVRYAGIAVSMLTGAIYGYNTSIIAGLSLTLVVNTYFPHGNDPVYLASLEAASLQGLLTACIMIGGAVGSVIGPIIAHQHGRRAALFVCGVIAVVPAVLLAVTSTFISTIILRTALGLAVGTACTVGPLYLSEIALPSERGRLGISFEIAITTGMLISMFINFIMSPHLNGDINDTLPTYNYQLQFGLGAIFGFMLMLLPLVLQETSVHHIEMEEQQQQQQLQQQQLSQQQPDNKELSNSEREQTVSQISSISTEIAVRDSIDSNSSNSNSVDAITTEADIDATADAAAAVIIDVPAAMPSELEFDKAATPTSSSATAAAAAVVVPPTRNGYTLLFRTPEGHKYLGYSILLCCIDMLTGINAIFFFSPLIFTNAGLSNVLLYTFVCVGVVNCSSCYAPYVLIDRVGRRPLMIVSLCGMTVSMLLLSINLIPGIYSTAVSSVLTIVLCCCYLAAWQLGTGAMFFLLATELFPDNIRDEACAFTNLFSWCINIFVSMVFPVLVAAVNVSNTLFMHTAVCLVTTVLTIMYLPETSQQTFAATAKIHK